MIEPWMLWFSVQMEENGRLRVIVHTSSGVVARAVQRELGAGSVRGRRVLLAPKKVVLLAQRGLPAGIIAAVVAAGQDGSKIDALNTVLEAVYAPCIEIKAGRKSSWKNQGMDPGAAETALVQAMGRCDACHVSAFLVPDHDHNTGQVRGALCIACNSALGFAKNSPRRLRGLAKYMERQNPT